MTLQQVNEIALNLNEQIFLKLGEKEFNENSFVYFSVESNGRDFGIKFIEYLLWDSQNNDEPESPEELKLFCLAKVNQLADLIKKFV